MPGLRARAGALGQRGPAVRGEPPRREAAARLAGPQARLRPAAGYRERCAEAPWRLERQGWRASDDTISEEQRPAHTAVRPYTVYGIYTLEGWTNRYTPLGTAP
jgi:hypothetical protein